MTDQKEKPDESDIQDAADADPAPKKADAEKAKLPDTIPYARFSQEVARRKQAETALSEVAEQLASDIPEEHRGLIPNLAPAAKIKWLQDARSSGLFGKSAKPEVPETDKAKPKTSPNATKSKDAGLYPSMSKL